MRFARVGDPGAEIPVVAASDGTWRDLSLLTLDLDGTFLAGGFDGLDPEVLPAVPEPQRFGPPLARPGKVVGIGLNYASYAAALGAAHPAAPVVFLKASSSITGPTDPIRPLRDATTTDHEVELGVVIGAELRDAQDAESALDAVAGYLLVDDVTDRERIANSPGPWATGKCADSYTPIGPWLVTPDELGEVDAVPLRLSVDGETRQDGTTEDMIFDVGSILVSLSQCMTLEPGDLVLTGTPVGTAVTRPEPRPYLRPGQVVEADGGILGRHRNEVVAR